MDDIIISAPILTPSREREFASIADYILRTKYAHYKLGSHNADEE